MPVNIEFKARVENLQPYRDLLQKEGAHFQGEDHQVDIYFEVPEGRLKLRQGSIENNLIFYHREDVAGSKRSDIDLYPVNDSEKLLTLLKHALGTIVTVDKKREIYWIDNIKIHLDTVDTLGTFLEVEAIDFDGTGSAEKLQQQCDSMQELFDITQDQMLDVSYSDMLLNQS